MASTRAANKNFHGDCIEFVWATEVSSGIADSTFRHDVGDGRSDNDVWTGADS
jgi:hypothetical protein